MKFGLMIGLEIIAGVGGHVAPTIVKKTMKKHMNIWRISNKNVFSLHILCMSPPIRRRVWVYTGFVPACSDIA